MAAMAWDYKDLVRVSGQSQSVVSQWLGRGSKDIKTIGKLEAAIAIARESGYSALWLAKGIGAKKATVGHPSVHRVEESGPTWATPEKVLEHLGRLLAAAPKERRRAIADNLSGWAMEGGADHWRGALLGLLVSPDKRRANG